jgi:hypothetical protein
MLLSGLAYSSALEDAGDMFLGKFGRVQNYIALYPRR